MRPNRNAVVSGSRTRTALAAALILLLTSACGTSNSADDTGAKGTDKAATLRIGLPVGTSLSPDDAAQAGVLKIATWPVYDRLLQVDLGNQYAPMLATAWKFSPDGKTLTLTLRTGVTFSNGEAFDAQAVKANLDHYRAAQGAAVQKALSSVTGVTVKGDHEVDIELNAPTTTVLAALSSQIGGIMVAPSAIGSKDLSTRPVGTGAYVIESFRPGQKVVYTRRKDAQGIWDSKTGKVAKVEMTTYSGTDAGTNALKSGQVDLISWDGSTADFGAELASGSVKHHKLNGSLNMVGIFLNPTKKPYDNVAVRQAVNMALNRKEIVKAFAPSAAPRVQPWPKGLPGFSDERESTYSHDPAGARKLLAEAGFPDGVDGGEILVASSGLIPKAAEAVQSDLAEAGIKIQLRVTDMLALITKYAESGSAGQIMYMTLPSIDAYSWLDLLFLTPRNNPAGPAPELAKLVEGTGDSRLSDAERNAKVGKVIDYATEQAVTAPLWQGVGGYMASSKVAGLDHPASLTGGVADFREVSVTR